MTKRNYEGIEKKPNHWMSGKYHPRILGCNPKEHISYNSDKTKLFISLTNTATAEEFKMGELDLTDISNSIIFICFEEFCHPSEFFFHANFLPKFEMSFSSYEKTIEQYRPTLNRNFKYCEISYDITIRGENLSCYDIHFHCNVHLSSHLCLSLCDLEHPIIIPKTPNGIMVENYYIRQFVSRSLRIQLDPHHRNFNLDNILDYYVKVRNVLSSKDNESPNNLLRTYQEITPFFICLKKKCIPILCIDLICKYIIEEENKVPSKIYFS